jgi:hypothetical protein
LGQKATSACVRATSALPLKADIQSRTWDVRFVPDPDIVSRALEPGRQSSALPGSMLLIDLGEPARTAFLAGNTKRVFKLN